MNHIQLPYFNQKSKLKVLAAFLEKPWAILLDSAGKSSHGSNNYNRYDIFSFNPSIKLSFIDQKTDLILSEQIKQLSSEQFNHHNLDLLDPLDCMRKITQSLQSKTIKHTTSLPFNGGWLGYIDYDFGRHLEKLPKLLQDEISTPKIQMGLYQWALITDHQLEQTQLFNFGLDSKSWQKVIQLFSNITDKKKNTTSYSDSLNFNLTSEWQSNTSQEAYYSTFKKVQQYIHDGDCYQVNFSQRFSATYQGSPIKAYQKLSEKNQAPFSAYLNFNDHQILSLSPERFIESHKNNVKTQPIKGTRPRKEDPLLDQIQAEELINSTKDRAENLMIVDLLRNDLSKTAAKGSVKVSELFGHYRFSSVHHLISTIESKLAPGYDNFDLLATSLPGGSITGTPKIRAMQIIEELEIDRRNIYCGIIAYIDFNHNMDSNICIRTLVAKNKKLYCWAGGGLVADSEVAQEYQETYDKLVKILPVLSPNYKAGN